MSDQDSFRRDTRQHKMTIELDQGVHRCLHFGNPGSSAYHFRLVTWPGGLSFSGDMGAFTFERLWDMFELFRDRSMTGKINAQYWHQKLSAVDKDGGSEDYSPARAKSLVADYIQGWEVTIGTAAKILKEVESEVLTPLESCSTENEAYDVIRDFTSSESHEFDQFEGSIREYSFRFLWCLRAIVWGIKQYDLVKEGRTQADHDRRVLAGEV